MHLVRFLHGFDLHVSLGFLERYPHRPLIDAYSMQNRTVLIGQEARFQCSYVTDYAAYHVFVKVDLDKLNITDFSNITNDEYVKTLQSLQVGQRSDNALNNKLVRLLW